MNYRRKSFLWHVVLPPLLVALVFFYVTRCAQARDFGQWQNADPDISGWYKSLMQPDHPDASCCGEADAYWADSFEVDGDHYVAIITDERPDAPLGRPHVDVGTRILIPNNKIKHDAGNPTGHGIVFVNPHGYVFCYLPPGGV